MVKHKSLLYKRSYYKFEQGSSFYIVEKENNTYKIGITNDINDRLREYRTLCPSSKLRYLVYCDKSRLIEDALLSRFDAYREHKNHEVLVDLDLSQITHIVQVIIDIVKLSANTIPQEQIDKYNTSIDNELPKEAEVQSEENDDKIRL